MKEKVINILAEISEKQLTIQSITGSTDIINDIGIDSLGMINLILKLEDQLDIQLDFEDFDISHLSSVDNLCKFLSDHCNMKDN